MAKKSLSVISLCCCCGGGGSSGSGEKGASSRRSFPLARLKTPLYLSFLFSLLLLIVVTFGYGFTGLNPTRYLTHADPWKTSRRASSSEDLPSTTETGAFSEEKDEALAQALRLSKAGSSLTDIAPLRTSHSRNKGEATDSFQSRPQGVKPSQHPGQSKIETIATTNQTSGGKPWTKLAAEKYTQPGYSHPDKGLSPGTGASSSKTDSPVKNIPKETPVEKEKKNSTIPRQGLKAKPVSAHAQNGGSLSESFWSDVPKSFPGWVRFGFHWSGGSLPRGSPHWQVVGTGVESFVYSAHFDNMTSPPLIRVIALLHKMIAVANITCRYYDSAQARAPSVDSVSGSLYHSRGLNGRKYVAAYADCPLVEGKRDYLPYAVSVNTRANDKVTNFLIVHYGNVRQKNTGRVDLSGVSPVRGDNRQLTETGANWRWNITRCFPSIQNRYNDHLLLAEMVAASLAMGVERFVFYVLSAGPDLWRMLKVLEKKGLAEIYPWNLHLVGSTVFYAGQSSAIQECFYRHLSQSRFLLFGDIDELFVPRKHTQLMPLLMEVFSQKSQCGAVTFRNVFFNLNRTINAPPPEQDRSGYAFTHQLKMLTHTRRIARVWPSPRRTKAAIDPRRVVTPGIHSVETLRKGYKLCAMDPAQGLLHHYRIITPKQSGPAKEIEDSYLWHYTPQIIRNFQELMQEFQKQPV